MSYGKILAELRYQRGVTQKELIHGLGRVCDLPRMEAGERMPEKLLADALFQRLGKTADILDYTITDEDYVLLSMREYLVFNLMEGCWSENEELLAEYARSKQAKKLLHRQYLAMMRALNDYCEKKDALLCKERLQSALEITFGGWCRESWADYYLCAQELRLAILLAYFKRIGDEPEAALQLLTKVQEYVEQRYDAWEQSKLLPQCTWMMARLYKEQGKWSEMERCCARGIRSLVENGALLLLEELLELQRIAIENMSEENRCTTSKSLSIKLESLRYVYQELGQAEKENRNDLQRILLHYKEQDIAIDYETLRDLRYARGISQFELSDGTRSAETISRMECGKHKPSMNSVRLLLDAMGVHKEYHQGRVQTEHYELYEMVYQRNQKFFQRNVEESKALVRELEACLDMSLPLNRQYIETCKIQAQRYDKTISPEEAISRLVEILHYTMPDYQGEVKRIPTREEFIVLNQIAVCEDQRGNLKKAIEIYEQILAVYHKSKVKEKYHTNSITLLYLNYGEMLECAGRLEEAEAAARRGLHIEVECGQGSLVGEYMANLAYVYRKSSMPEKKQKVEPYLRHAYVLCELMQLPRKAEIVKKCYKECCGKELSYYHLL